MNITIDTGDLDKFVADARKAGMNVDPLMKGAIVNSVNKIQSNTRRLAPHRTGQLQRSIQTRVDYPSGQVDVTEKYGAYVEGGTGIYGPSHTKITPKRAKVLAFTVGGKAVFARSVKGMKARPFFVPGINDSLSYINDQFDKVTERLVNALAGR